MHYRNFPISTILRYVIKVMILTNIGKILAGGRCSLKSIIGKSLKSGMELFTYLARKTVIQITVNIWKTVNPCGIFFHVESVYVETPPLPMRRLHYQETKHISLD